MARKNVKAPISDVRKAINRCKNENGEITVKQLTQEFDLTGKGYLVIGRRVRQLMNQGSIERVRIGVYRVVNSAISPVLTDSDKMWTVFRAKKVVDYDSLQELAGVSNRNTVACFMRLLVKFGYARRINNAKKGRYQLIKDPVERPKLHSKMKIQEGKS